MKEKYQNDLPVCAPIQAMGNEYDNSITGQSVKTEQCSGATSQHAKVAGTALSEINSRIPAPSLRPTSLIAMLHCLAVSGLFHLHSSNASQS